MDLHTTKHPTGIPCQDVFGVYLAPYRKTSVVAQFSRSVWDGHLTTLDADFRQNNPLRRHAAHGYLQTFLSFRDLLDVFGKTSAAITSVEVVAPVNILVRVKRAKPRLTVIVLRLLPFGVYCMRCTHAFFTVIARCTYTFMESIS